MSYHNGYRFATKDKDDGNKCASSKKRGGWWYRNCATTNPNGPYVKNADGLYWEVDRTVTPSKQMFPKTFQMAIRPSSN